VIGLVAEDKVAHAAAEAHVILQDPHRVVTGRRRRAAPPRGHEGLVLLPAEVTPLAEALAVRPVGGDLGKGFEHGGCVGHVDLQVGVS